MKVKMDDDQIQVDFRLQIQKGRNLYQSKLFIANYIFYLVSNLFGGNKNNELLFKKKKEEE